jgi:beta-N-acetylglucosaminidase
MASDIEVRYMWTQRLDVGSLYLLSHSGMEGFGGNVTLANASDKHDQGRVIRGV